MIIKSVVNLDFCYLNLNIFYVFVKPFIANDIQTGRHSFTKSGFQISSFKPNQSYHFNQS